MSKASTFSTPQAASPARRLLLAESCLVKSSGLKNNLNLHQRMLQSSSVPAFLQKILMSAGYRHGGLNVRQPEPMSRPSISKKLAMPQVVFRISPDTTANVQP
ncbi:MAG: hypothetical protein ABSC24_05270 [Verrucomicrobiota bacterium]